MVTQDSGHAAIRQSRRRPTPVVRRRRLPREQADLFTLGELANLVRERKNGNAYYNVNTHLNPTNVCVYRCTFCAFRADLKSAEGLRDDRRADRRSAPREADGTRRDRTAHRRRPAPPAAVRLVPERRPHRSTRRYPELHLKAYTAVEMGLVRSPDRAGRRATCSPSSRTPASAACPAAAPRSSTPRSATRSASTRPTPTTWLDIHREAHELGLHSNATMLYGHIEKPQHRIDHLIRLRELQDETGGFQTFIPLAFHPDNTELGTTSRSRSGADGPARRWPISRLMLDNFPHIKAYWVMLGIKTAQVALSFGADDIDGTVVHEKIYHDAGRDSPQELTVAELRRLIDEAGRVPVERDTLYNEVVREEGKGTWQTGRAIRGLELVNN